MTSIRHGDLIGVRGWLAAAVLLGLAAMPATARAGTFGVEDSLTTFGVGGACDTTTRYLTATGGTNGAALSGCTTTTGPGNTTAAGLTAAAQSMTNGATFSGSFAGDGFSATTTASANLRTASLHLTDDCHSIGSGAASACRGLAVTSLWDNVTFHIAHPGSGGVTHVPVTFTVDGTVGSPADAAALASLQISNAFSAGVADHIDAYGGPAFVFGSGCGGRGTFYLYQGSDLSSSYTCDTSLVAWHITTDTATKFVVTGDLALTGSSPVIGLAADMAFDVANNATADFGDTARISFALPPGVTTTSDSTVFGTPIPEPASLSLFGLATVLTRLVRRRRVRPYRPAV